jgi:hypothetical protein
MGSLPNHASPPGAGWVSRLTAAVLLDSIRILFEGRDRRRWLEEFRWVESTDRHYAFTFERVCEALDVNAARLRLQVRELGREKGMLPAQPLATGSSDSISVGTPAVPERTVHTDVPGRIPARISLTSTPAAVRRLCHCRSCGTR